MEVYTFEYYTHLLQYLFRTNLYIKGIFSLTIMAKPKHISPIILSCRNIIMTHNYLQNYWHLNLSYMFDMSIYNTKHSFYCTGCSYDYIVQLGHIDQTHRLRITFVYVSNTRYDYCTQWLTHILPPTTTIIVTQHVTISTTTAATTTTPITTK